MKAFFGLTSTVPRLIMARGGSTMLWSFIDQFMVSGCNFLIGIAAARYLGIAEFGKFTLVLMIVGFATVVQGTIISVPMVTLAGQRPGRSASYFAAVTLWGAGLSAGFALVTAAIVAGVHLARGDPSPTGLLLAVIALSIFFGLHDVVRRVLFARRRGGSAFMLDAMRFGLFGGAVLVLHVLGVQADATLVLAAMGASAAVAVLPFFVGLVRARLRLRLFQRVWHRHWMIGRWLVLMVLVATGQEQVIWIGVATGLGDTAVGALRAGQYLLGITHFILMAVENFLPRQAAVEYRRGGVVALKTYLVRQTMLLGVVTGLLILTVAVPARFWLTTVFGPEFGDYAPLLWVYSLTYAVIFLRSIWVFYLRTIEDTRSVFRSFLVSSVTAVICAWPAIATFGIAGAATVILAAHVVCMIAVLMAVRRHLRAAGLDPHPAAAPARAG